LVRHDVAFSARGCGAGREVVDFDVLFQRGRPQEQEAASNNAPLLPDPRETDVTMRLYWSWQSIPELSGLPSAERARLLLECRKKVVWHWQVWLAILVGALGFIGAFFLAIALTTGGGLSWPFAVLVVGGGWGVLFGFMMDQVCIPITRRYLRDAREAGRASERFRT